MESDEKQRRFDFLCFTTQRSVWGIDVRDRSTIIISQRTGKKNEFSALVDLRGKNDTETRKNILLSIYRMYEENGSTDEFFRKYPGTKEMGVDWENEMCPVFFRMEKEEPFSFSLEHYGDCDSIVQVFSHIKTREKRDHVVSVFLQVLEKLYEMNGGSL